MGFKKIVGKTQERTSELNKEFIEEISKLYHTFSNQDITRHLESNMKMLELGGRYSVIAAMRENDINWNTLCNYMIVDVTFNDVEDANNNRIATLLIEDDGGYDNESWRKLKAIMNGDVLPESEIPQDKNCTSDKVNLNKLPHGILIRTQGTDFFYSEDEFDYKSLDTKNNSLKLYRGNEVIKYFNLDYVVTIDLDYRPEVNDYAELKEELLNGNKK